MMDVEKVFNYLLKFKSLPSYQFERRLDAFLLPYVEKAFNNRFSDLASDFVLLYPEFPLWPKKKNKYELDKSSNRHVYVDYLLWSKTEKLVLFVELKTDKSSVLQEQFDRYLLNCKEGWENLFRHYFKKAIHSGRTSSSWKKFCYGLELLFDKAPELTGSEKGFELNHFIACKRGQGVTGHLEAQYSKVLLKDTPIIKLIYLAPKHSISSINKTSADAQTYYQGYFPLRDFAEFTDEPLKSLLLEID